MIAWAVIVTAIALFFWLRGKRSGAPLPAELQLRLRILRRLRGPAADAESILERTLAGARRRFPEKDELWHLRRVLADLDHDRR